VPRGSNENVATVAIDNRAGGFGKKASSVAFMTLAINIAYGTYGNQYTSKYRPNG
jgi:hypothetical protein